MLGLVSLSHPSLHHLKEKPEKMWRSQQLLAPSHCWGSLALSLAQWMRPDVQGRDELEMGKRPRLKLSVSLVKMTGIKAAM